MSNAEPNPNAGIDFTSVEQIVIADPRVRELTRLAVDEVVTAGILLGVRDALTGSGDKLHLADMDPLVINDAIGDSDDRLAEFLAELRQTLRSKTASQITDVYLNDAQD